MSAALQLTPTREPRAMEISLACVGALFEVDVRYDIAGANQHANHGFESMQCCIGCEDEGNRDQQHDD